MPRATQLPRGGAGLGTRFVESRARFFSTRSQAASPPLEQCSSGPVFLKLESGLVRAPLSCHTCLPLLTPSFPRLTCRVPVFLPKLTAQAHLSVELSACSAGPSSSQEPLGFLFRAPTTRLVVCPPNDAPSGFPSRQGGTWGTTQEFGGFLRRACFLSFSPALAPVPGAGERAGTREALALRGPPVVGSTRAGVCSAVIRAPMGRLGRLRRRLL